MEITSDVNALIENLISSYEAQINSIESVISKSDAITKSSSDLLNEFSCSLKDLRIERDIINSELRENLAKNGSLRKKDYNRMMEDILNTLDEREREAGESFYEYLDSQKNMVQYIKKGILEVKDYIKQDKGEKIQTFRDKLKQITQEMELKKGTVIQQFINYQNLHIKIVGKLEILLERRDRIFSRDLKEVHCELKNEIN
jgi:hypothetical protein